jgi:hypothetical protein
VARVSQTEVGVVSKISQLEQISKQAEKLTIGFTLITEGQVLESYKITFHAAAVTAEHVGFGRFYKNSLPDAMQALAKGISVGKVLSVESRSTMCPLSAKDLKRLTLEAWCEAFNTPVPSEGALKKAASDNKSQKDAVRDALLADLRQGGGDGLARWNAWAEKKLSAVKHFRKSDLQGASLTGAKLVMLDFQGTNFENCRMSGVSFYGGDVRSCNFQNADLTGAKFSGTLNGANFTGACLKNAQLRGSTLSNANYSGTDFSGADFSYVDLRGSNLSKAKLDDVVFEYTKFDEKTLWPDGFASNKGLVFSGSGKDPFLAEKIKAILPAGKVDFEWFISRLEKEFDEKRMEKALKMLKAESFQLFAEVSSGALVGVVKSQTSADLFYSCFLKEGGTFSCCSQHLAPCGGLRGALCKHLLVLLIGMTKAGKLDPGTSCEWVLASRTRNPSMDKELMTSTLLRYKGAEAGEVDWRPTETMPEDYYAF